MKKMYKKENDKMVKINGVDRKILYSLSAIHTKDKYDVKYGKIEMRAAMPKGIGVCPVFWTWTSGYAIKEIGDPAALEEIDIVNVALTEKTGIDGDVDFLTEMKVDYVRVYKKDK